MNDDKKNPALAEQGLVENQTNNILKESNLKNLATALAKAQGELKPAHFDTENSHFRNRYASLASVWSAVKDVFPRNGLSVTQLLETVDQKPMLRTILLHSSGEKVESLFELRIERPGMQAFGSALTYARRYALSSICGVVADEDDDANASDGVNSYETRPPLSASPSPQASPRVTRQNAPTGKPRNETPITDAQGKKLFAMSKSKNIAPDEMTLVLSNLYGVDSSKALKQFQVQQLFEELDREDFDMQDLIVRSTAVRMEREASRAGN